MTIMTTVSVRDCIAVHCVCSTGGGSGATSERGRKGGVKTRTIYPNTSDCSVLLFVKNKPGSPPRWPSD